MTDWIDKIIIILTSLCALTAWIAKIRWSKEYRTVVDMMISAKDAQIKEVGQRLITIEKSKEEALDLKDQQIAVLRYTIEGLEKTSSDLLAKRYEKTKVGLEDYIEELERKYKRAKERTKELESEISDGVDSGELSRSERAKNEKAKKSLMKDTELIEKGLRVLKFSIPKPGSQSFNYFPDPGVLNSLGEASLRIDSQLNLSTPKPGGFLGGMSITTGLLKNDFDILGDLRPLECRMHTADYLSLDPAVEQVLFGRTKSKPFKIDSASIASASILFPSTPNSNSDDDAEIERPQESEDFDSPEGQSKNP